MAALYKEDLGRQIKQRRDQLGLTQRELADRAHVKEATTVSRWERGERAPTDLDAVAQALQTTAQQMLSELSPLHQKDRRPLDRSGGTQLDRIEEKLDRVLRLLAAGAAPKPAGELGRRIAKPKTTPKAPKQAQTRRARGSR